MAQKVLFSNTGKDICNLFDKVIILHTVHRLRQIENPQTPDDHAYNVRADQFLATLHRVRDLTLSAGDYF